MKKDKNLSKNKSNSETLKEQLKRESLLVRENSMTVLKQFEAIEILADNLAKESKREYWTNNKKKFIN